MLRFSCLRIARPKPRSWKNPGTAKAHFTYVSEREINQGKTVQDKLRENHQQQQDQQKFVETSDASTATAKMGNSIFSLLQQINPTRNVDLMSKKPWLRKGVIWAQTVKLTEFGHISNYLAPAYIGTGFACTVAVVRESCDTLALQVPFIPLHLALLHVLTIWSVTCCGYLVQNMVARWRGDKEVHIKIFDGFGALIIHALCGVVLLLGHHAVAAGVAMSASPLILANLYFQIQHDYQIRMKREREENISNEPAKANTNSSKKMTGGGKSSPSTTVSADVISKVMKDQQQDLESGNNNQSKQQQNSSAGNNNNAGPTGMNTKENDVPAYALPTSDEPSRVAMLVSSSLTAIPMLVGYASLLGRLDPTICVPIALSGMCWGMMHHTFRGGNALFLSWGGRKRIKVQLFALSGASYILLNAAGFAAGQTLFYYVFLGWAWFHMLGVVDHFRPGDTWSTITAQRRMRASMWFVFLAVCAGNLLWLLLVAAVAEIRDVDPEDDTRMIEHPPIAEQKKTKSGVLSKILTLTVQPSSYTSMDQFSWTDRMVKPILVYASIQKFGSQHNASLTHDEMMDKKKKKNNNASDTETETTEESSASSSTQQQRRLGDAADSLDMLEIPVYYRREFFGENVVALMGKSGLVDQENIDKFEHKYLSLVDHYSPYGAM